MDLQGKVALVTGASSGIGRAVALRLARAGMRVAVTARRAERLQALRDEAPEGDWLLHPADLGDEASILALFEAIDERWGALHVLVNNAGLGRNAPLLSGETQAWRTMLDVNVLALAICTREAVRRMGDEGGHVLHVSSMSAHRVAPGGGMYAASKHAVKALTEGLRQELLDDPRPIRVGAISPGFVQTEFARKFHGSQQAEEQTYGQFPVISADELASAVQWMLQQPEHVLVQDLLLRPRQQAI